jgi:hypothetical protein
MTPLPQLQRELKKVVAQGFAVDREECVTTNRQSLTQPPLLSATRGLGYSEGGQLDRGSSMSLTTWPVRTVAPR